MRVTARVDSMMMIEYYHSVMWAVCGPLTWCIDNRSATEETEDCHTFSRLIMPSANEKADRGVSRESLVSFDLELPLSINMPFVKDVKSSAYFSCVL